MRARQIELGGGYNVDVVTLSDIIRLLQLPEVEREAVLAARLEELQRYQDKVNLENMLKAQSGGGDELANQKRVILFSLKYLGADQFLLSREVCQG